MDRNVGNDHFFFRAYIVICLAASATVTTRVAFLVDNLVLFLLNRLLSNARRVISNSRFEFRNVDEINKLATGGLTPEELQRAKKKLIGQQEIANQSNDAFGYHCALDELYGLGFDFYKRLEHDVNAVTLEDIKKVAAKYFRDQPYVLATVQPPEKK